MPEIQTLDIANHSVYKMSHGPGDIKEENLKLFLERQVIVIHKDTKAKGRSKSTQGEDFKNMEIGDYFYLCRGNQKLLLLGRITGKYRPCSVPDLGKDGWIERPYEVVALCQKEGKFDGQKHWWLPNDNSTCIPIRSDQMQEANKILFEPYFHCRLKAMDSNMPQLDAPTPTPWHAKNTILYGPPGTGKTYHTVNMALSLVDPNFLLENRPRKEIVARFHELTEQGRILFTTFHQSMSYEEFVEGIKPSLSEESLQYIIEPGVFRRICDNAERNWIESQGTMDGSDTPVPCVPYVLIIDEINRGNVSAIFGELITLLEDDKRMGEENELRIVLPYSKESFAVPPNLYVIGTMNTADRSVEALDTALRRRFAFEEMIPQPQLLGAIEDGTPDQSIDLQRMLSTINSRLEYLMGRDHTIGHAFFLSVKSLGDLRRIFQSKLIPQLQEYFYGDWSKVALVLGSAFVKNKQPENPVFWPKGLDEPDDDRARWEITPIADWQWDSFRSIYSA